MELVCEVAAMNAHLGKRDPSKQGHRTPPEFLRAVERRFGAIGFDLAATSGHEVANEFFAPEENSLAQNWANIEHVEPVVFLNPPFSNIRPWVAKLDAECRNLQRFTVCLVPASVGAAWYRKHAMGKAFSLFLDDRITFVDQPDPYPRDCMLLVYGFGLHGSDSWDWMGELREKAAE